MQARMRQMVHFAVVAVALGVMIGDTTLAQSDSLLATWKLNLEKSKFDPGPPPMSDTIVNEAWESNGLKYTDTTVQVDGTRVISGAAAHYDGKDYKVTGDEDSDTLSAKRLDANTTEFMAKKAGKVVGAGKAVVSRNGKMQTLTWTAMNAKGQKVHNVEVYDKQ